MRINIYIQHCFQAAGNDLHKSSSGWFKGTNGAQKTPCELWPGLKLQNTLLFMRITFIRTHFYLPVPVDTDVTQVVSACCSFFPSGSHVCISAGKAESNVCRGSPGGPAPPPPHPAGGRTPRHHRRPLPQAAPGSFICRAGALGVRGRMAHTLHKKH